MMDRLLNNETATKAFSLALALLLWFFVGVQNPETEVPYRNIPIQTVMQNAQIENGVSVVSVGEDTVDITLKGNKNVLNRISASDIFATIEVDASLSPGVYNLPINVTLPLDDVVITGKHPTGCDVRVDRLDAAVIPVRAEVSYDLDETVYVIGAPEIRPETIEIRGPASEVAVIKEAVVKLSVTEENVMQESVNLPITLYDNSGAAADTTYIETAVRSAMVTPRISVRRTLPVRVDLLNLPDGWLSADFSYSIVPSSIEINVPVYDSGAMTEYAAGQIDLAEHRESATVSLPIASEYMQPGGLSTVSVVLKFGQLSEGSFMLDELEFDNLPQGTSYELLSAMPLEVALRGKPSAMESYDGSALRGVVDLSSGGPGATLDLPVRIITGNQEVGPLGSYKVTVRLSEGS